MADREQEADAQQMVQAIPGQITQAVCPNCGYCPHCGRHGYVGVPLYPMYPQRNYPGYPWQSPWIVYGTTTISPYGPNVC